MTDIGYADEDTVAGLWCNDRFETHSLKVEPPYLDAILSGEKNFEVRRNDRGFQQGDLLYLNEWHPRVDADTCHRCRVSAGHSGHYSGRKAVRWVSYVYSGDPRFGGLEPGFVVLGLLRDEYTDSTERT